MKTIRVGLGLFLAFFTVALATAASDQEEAQKQVVESGQTLDNFTADPEMTWFRDHAKDAKGLLICSSVVKAGFILGGSGGRCVFVAKGEHSWNGPAFYTMGTASIGFQVGAEKAQIILLAMTQKAVDSLMSSSFKLAGEASVSAGPVGTGTGATATDFVSFSRSKGLYGGVDVSGAVIKPTDDYNKAYYGKTVSPIEIISKGSVHNQTAALPLISKVAKLYGEK
jgi:SH3 domain-containing YSC84-like protein 1